MSENVSRRAFIAGSSALTVKNLLGGVGGWHARPTPRMIEWSEQEIGMFFHYDLQIFQPRGKKVDTEHCREILDPKLYQPVKLDTDQWMDAAKAIGAKYVVLVARHGSGFLQWQSDVYPYSLKQTSWRDGKGDLVADFVTSARRAGLKPGLYCLAYPGVWLSKRHPAKDASGKENPEVVRYQTSIIEKVLREVWSNYGEFYEIWFDGGARPVSKGGPNTLKLIRELQPNAVVFQGPGPLRNQIRWLGNERGVAPYPCWSTAGTITSSDGSKEASFPGHPNGDMWIPGECDVTLRNHRWFWTPEDEPHPDWTFRTADVLEDIYLTSVGRNCNMLLNCTPNVEGLVPQADFDIYREFGRRIRARFGKAVAETAGSGDSITLKLPDVTKVRDIVIQEDITCGHCILAYEIDGEMPEGGFKTLCSGESIGHKRIETLESVAVRALRFRVVRSVDSPRLKKFAAYGA